MFKKGLKLLFIVLASVVIIHETASARTSVFLETGMTKTSESNANILKASCDGAFDNCSYYRPSFNDNYKAGTYKTGISYTNDYDVISKARVKYLKKENKTNLDSEGTNDSFIKIVDFVNNSSAKQVDATVEDEMLVIDASVGKKFSFLKSFEGDISAGLRYADVERQHERIIEGYDHGTVAAGTHSTQDITEKFSGYGIRFSGDGRYGITNRFGVFGGVGLSILSGEKEIKNTEIDRTNNASDITRVEEDCVTTVTDISVGFDWRQEIKGEQYVTLSLGYEMEKWTNILTHMYTDADAPVGDPNDFSTDTFFVRVTYDF